MSTHAAEFYVEIEPEFNNSWSSAIRRLRAKKITQNKPDMRQGAAYVKVKISLPDETWNRAVPEAEIEIPVGSIGPIKVTGDPIPVGPEDAEVINSGFGDPPDEVVE